MSDNNPSEESAILVRKNLPSAIHKRQSARVYIVGAGPGHPGLLTLRAVECLAQADLVLYDKLVPPALLDHVPASARRICVANLTPCHSERTGPLVDLMLEAARAGKCVVRLKGGDPFIFGRGGEEVELLRAAGIAYEVVPGITAAVGAAACAGIPLTHRAYSSAVALVTGHEHPDKTTAPLDWAALARFPGTLVIYMGLSRLGQIAQTLIEEGLAADTPSAVIQWGTTGHQQTVAAPLHELPVAVQKAGLASPALIVIGRVVALREQLHWFEQRPLFGKRILVTRPRAQARTLVHHLELLGAVPFVLPAVEVQALEDWSEVDEVLADLGQFQWLVFSSTNGVEAFLGRLRQTGRDLRALGGIKLAAIGPRTADTLRHYHLEPDLVPSVYRSEELAEALRPLVSGQRVLLARADRGRDVLPLRLAEVAEVRQLTVYRQVDAVASEAAELDHLRRGEVDYITLTSPSIARALGRCLDAITRVRLERGEIKVVTISPVTSAAVREMGLPVAAEAKIFTIEGLLEALVELARGRA